MGSGIISTQRLGLNKNRIWRKMPFCSWNVRAGDKSIGSGSWAGDGDNRNSNGVGTRICLWRTSQKPQQPATRIGSSLFSGTSDRSLGALGSSTSRLEVRHFRSVATHASPVKPRVPPRVHNRKGYTIVSGILPGTAMAADRKLRVTSGALKHRPKRQSTCRTAHTIQEQGR